MLRYVALACCDRLAGALRPSLGAPVFVHKVKKKKKKTRAVVLVKFSGDGACYLHDFVSGCGAPPLNVSGKVFWYVQLFHFGFF